MNNEEKKKARPEDNFNFSESSCFWRRMFPMPFWSDFSKTWCGRNGFCFLPFGSRWGEPENFRKEK